MQLLRNGENQKASELLMGFYIFFMSDIFYLSKMICATANANIQIQHFFLEEDVSLDLSHQLNFVKLNRTVYVQ